MPPTRGSKTNHLALWRLRIHGANGGSTRAPPDVLKRRRTIWPRTSFLLADGKFNPAVSLTFATQRHTQWHGRLSQSVTMLSCG
jgi:hypothetical protein